MCIDGKCSVVFSEDGRRLIVSREDGRWSGNMDSVKFVFSRWKCEWCKGGDGIVGVIVEWRDGIEWNKWMVCSKCRERLEGR